MVKHAVTQNECLGVCESVNLAVNLGGLMMQNPLTVASGTFGSGREYHALWRNAGYHDGIGALGAITTKGVSLKPWDGNAGIRITQSAAGMLNSIGLQNKGVEEFCAIDLAWLKQNAAGTAVIVNVCGHSLDEYQLVIQRLEEEASVSAYELNISCPNVSCGGMSFGTDALLASELTARCRTLTKRPLIVKLTPNVTDITEIARAIESAGADAVSLINTVAGMSIDIKSRKALFERKVAGLSGPAIKPVALWAVYRVAQAVNIPVLGMGGICTVEDCVEFLLAGACALAVGTASFNDPLSAPHLLEGLQQWCEQNGVRNVSELTGALN
ncbi:MAG: dihydroorotate dehydrogenase [Coriobacteriales bacterium]|jgi:dihydroorotate dehydrogenase (NAD+) catalytic subunit|nr:dihydroorotate dehydrogenase [Coriobacteriales bacterium]